MAYYVRAAAGFSLLFDGFKLEFHHLAAHYVTQIVFPEPAEARKMIHQKLEPQPAPQRQQPYVHLNFAEPSRRVVAEAAVILAEVAERKTVQMPAVGGIAERTEVGVVRCHQKHAPRWRGHAMKFLHGGDHVRDMLDDMDGAHARERIVAKRIRKAVEIADDVGAAARIPVDADGAGIFVDAAADVQRALRRRGGV